MLRIIMLLRFMTFFLSAIIFNGCHKESNLATHYSQDFNRAESIKLHMSILADDAMEGREAGTRGERAAADYIVKTYQDIGLEVAVGMPSHLQKFSLRHAQINIDYNEVQFLTNTGVSTHQHGEDVAFFPSFNRHEFAGTYPLVFVGHGIQAPKLGIDNYDGVNVAKKVVVLFSGAPEGVPSEEAAHFGSATEKIRTARVNGAIGTVFISHHAFTEGDGFARTVAAVSRPLVRWFDKDQGLVLAPTVPFDMGATSSALGAIFEGTRFSLSDLKTMTKTGLSQAVDLKTRIKAQTKTSFDDRKMSQNVAGFILGSDPVLRNELVVLTAHYDHVGICAPESETDKICNGALDNAYGTALLLDVAREIQISDVKPRRSILFLAVGAEEEGLLGSDYFVNYPLWAADKIVANINLDGGMPFYDFSDLIAFGAEQSQMGEMLSVVAEEMGLDIAPDPFPELNIFVRSDQYSFVKKGVPALFLYNGFTNMVGENVGQKKWDEAFANYYHQPGDDLSRPIDYKSGAKMSRVFEALAREVANSPTRPLWYDDSVFGALFDAGNPKAQRP